MFTDAEWLDIKELYSDSYRGLSLVVACDYAYFLGFMLKCHILDHRLRIWQSEAHRKAHRITP